MSHLKKFKCLLAVLTLVMFVVVTISGNGITKSAYATIIPPDASPGQFFASSTPQTSSVLRIYGLVDKPLNLTYDELLSFPMVSEVAELKCVDGFPDVTGNWTGIPLFYLLTLAQVRSDAYKVVTYGSDGYSSDLLVEEALSPTTILALSDNGTTTASGIEPLPRLIVPNNWGYKWVAEVDAIEVVNSDYKGLWESNGYSDDATRPGQTVLPSIIPSLQQLNFTLGNLQFNEEVFTNASINAYALNYSQKQVILNVTVLSGSLGFADFKLPQEFLKGPYDVTIDNQATDVVEADVDNQSYIYSSLPEGFHTVGIVGTEIFGLGPEILVSLPQNVYVGENAVFDASRTTANGAIVSYQWSFGDGTNGTGAVVSHSYSNEGTYQVGINVIESGGLGSSETLTVTVENQPHVPLALELFLASVSALLIFMFAVLLMKRK